MSPDDLRALALAELQQRKAGALRVAREHRQRAAEARAAGEPGIARTLGLLAAHLEQAAALAEAERRDRIARHAKAERAEAAREAARAPRRTDPLRAAILDALAPLKRGGADFKSAMRTWERHRIESLRLTPIGDDAYEVSDEDSIPPAAKRYTWASLRTLYGQSDKPRR